MLKISSFKVQFGIICACVPTLRPGYLRLSGKWSKAKSTPSGQTPFNEKPSTEHVNKFKPWSPPKISSDTGSDAFTGSGSVDPILPSHQIRKTTRIDVEQNESRIAAPAPSNIPPLPSPEADLEPGFGAAETDRGLWTRFWTHGSRIRVMRIELKAKLTANKACGCSRFIDQCRNF